MSIGEKFYVGSTPLLQVDCIINITNATTIEILYQKPAGTTGTWTADSIATDENSGLGRYLDYQIQAAELDAAGEWKFHAHVVIDGRDLYGEVATHEIFALFS